jgi:hypothetical protein
MVEVSDLIENKQIISRNLDRLRDGPSVPPSSTSQHRSHAEFLSNWSSDVNCLANLNTAMLFCVQSSVGWSRQIE